MDSAEFISRHGIMSKIILAVLLYILIRYAHWGLESDKPGLEVAMILGAVFTPMIGLFKYVFTYADSRNNMLLKLPPTPTPDTTHTVNPINSKSVI